MKVKQEDGTTLVVGGVPVVELTDGTFFSVPGCPVADGKGPCSTTCGGGWPGTRVTTEQLTAAVVAGRIIPENLGCQPLEQRARAGLQEIQQSAVLFSISAVSVDVENAS